MRSALARNVLRGSSFAASPVGGVTLRHATKTPIGLMAGYGEHHDRFAFCRSSGDNVGKRDRCAGIGPPIHPMDSARHVDLPAVLDDRSDRADPAHALRIVPAERRRGADSRRRVLFVIPTMSGGGAERVFLHLMN